MAINAKPARGTATRERRLRTARRLRADAKHSEAVKARSGGRCEVVVVYGDSIVPYGCWETATQVHHMIGGSGKRARGMSQLPEHKQHCCDECHQLITDRKLIRIGGDVPLWTDRYRVAE